MQRWIWRRYYNFKYRKVDDDLCCCGSNDCGGDYSHSYVNAKEYAIKCAVEHKINTHRG